MLKIVEENIKNTMTPVFDTIEAATPKGKLPLKIFKDTFLNLFLLKDMKDADEKIKVWISIAGSPVSEVELIDEDGKVVDIVPPLYDSAATLGIMSRGKALGDIIHEYQQRTAITQSSADNFLYRNLNTKMENAGAMIVRNSQWLPFLEKYAVKNATAAKHKSDPSEVEDIFGVD